MRESELIAALGIGAALAVTGAAMVVASRMIDLTPSVCPFCGLNHFPTAHWKFYVRPDVGLAIVLLGLLVALLCVSKRTSRPGTTTGDED